MVKPSKVIKETNTSILSIGSSFYVRVPMDFVQDSAFPILILKDVVKKLKGGVTVKIKMLEDKLIVEEE